MIKIICIKNPTSCERTASVARRFEPKINMHVRCFHSSSVSARDRSEKTRNFALRRGKRRDILSGIRRAVNTFYSSRRPWTEAYCRGRFFRWQRSNLDAVHAGSIFLSVFFFFYSVLFLYESCLFSRFLRTSSGGGARTPGVIIRGANRSNVML